MVTAVNLTALRTEVSPSWVEDPAGRGTWVSLMLCSHDTLSSLVQPRIVFGFDCTSTQKNYWTQSGYKFPLDMIISMPLFLLIQHELRREKVSEQC
jgi:hypothetical protein